MAYITLEDARKVYDFTRTALSLGSATKSATPDQALHNRISFARALLTYCRQEKNPGYFLTYPESHPYTMDATATLAAANQAGNCGEMACLAFQHFLSYDGSKVIVELRTEKKSEGDVSKTHMLVVLNLSPSADITNLSTWNPEAIVVDPWADGEACYCIKDVPAFSKATLAEQGKLTDDLEKITISRYTEHLGRLSPVESQLHAKFLTELKPLVLDTIRDEFKDMVEEMKWEADGEVEYKKFSEAFEKRIGALTSVGLYAPKQATAAAASAELKVALSV